MTAGFSRPRNPRLPSHRNPSQNIASVILRAHFLRQQIPNLRLPRRVICAGLGNHRFLRGLFPVLPHLIYLGQKHYWGLRQSIPLLPRGLAAECSYGNNYFGPSDATCLETSCPTGTENRSHGSVFAGWTVSISCCCISP